MIEKIITANKRHKFFARPRIFIVLKMPTSDWIASLNNIKDGSLMLFNNLIQSGVGIFSAFIMTRR